MRQCTLLLLASLLMVSCSEDREQPAPPVAIEKTLFDELKERTIKNPGDADAWYHLSDIYERSGNYNEEVNALNKFLALKPREGYAYIKLGTAHNRLGQYKDAIRNFETAIKYNSRNALLYNNVAISYGKIGDMDKEIAALKKALSLRPRYATARYNLGIVYLKKGKRDEALKQYREIKKFDEGIATALKKEIDAKGR